jgi:hypothetical protein
MKFLLFSFFILLTDGANILILHPIYSGSHEHVLRTVGEHLVENRGHNVTQVHYLTVVSNHFLSVVTFATIVTTTAFLSLLLSELERYVMYLYY